MILLALLLTLAPPPLTQDASFDAITAEQPGVWEFRYATKASDPESRPRWRVLFQRDPDPQRGGYLETKKTGPACGAVLIGQRVTLPATLDALELRASYQTFCEMDGRSGSLDLALFEPAVWDAMGKQPDDAKAPAQALLQRTVHANKDDQETWRRASVRGSQLDDVLARFAGQPVIVAVVWSTWHPTSNEWLKLDDVALASPAPYASAAGWPRRTYAGEPVRLPVDAVLGDGRLSVAYRPVGGAWQVVPADPAGPSQFEAIVPAAAVNGPLEARTVLEADGQLQEGDIVSIAMMQRPTRPNLLYSRDELVAMKAKVERFAWAQEAWAGVKQNADDWLDTPIDPPLGPGGWSHDYVCPDDGARLKMRDDHPHDHLCPVCGKEWQGEKLDGNYRNSIHGRYASAARNLGLAYQLTGDARYGRQGAAILNWYADHYAQFPEGRGPAGKGKVMSQSLTECGWLIQMIGAADLLDGALTAEERTAVEQRFVRAGVNQIRKFTFGIHNIQCWHNTCLAIAGYYLGDPELIAAAEDGPLGFHQQVEKGILPDGMWFERSLGYHGYTVSALTTHIIAARHNGKSIEAGTRFPLMLTLPLRLAFPNLVQPSLNDQGYTRSPIGPDNLELAVAWYQDPVAAQALHKLYAMGRERGGMEVWQFGNELPEAGDYQPPGSADLPGSGLVVLRRGAGEASVCAMLEYGEHGGGHGHPDKLQLILYGLGQTLLPDPGTVGYGAPLHGQWFKTTVAHNALVINHASQQRTTGKLLHFQAGEAYDVAGAESDEAYPGYHQVRRLLLTDRYLVDVFDVSGESAADLDLFVHGPGLLTIDRPLRPLTEAAPNATYARLEDLQGLTTAETVTATWSVGEAGKLAVTVAGAPDTQIARTLCQNLAAQDKGHALRIRRHVAATRFVVVHQMLPAGAEAAAVAAGDGWVQIGPQRVSVPDGEAPLSM